MAFDSSPSHLLLVINWDAHGLLSLLFRDVPGHTRSTFSLYEGLSPFYDGIFYDVYGYLFFPTVLETDRLNNWQKVLRHTPVSMVEYYLIKVVGLFVDFLLSIGVVFTVGHVVRHVNMSLQDWVLSAFILILGSLAFVALGLVLTLLPSSQLMSVVGNLLYMGLAVMGGLWMPISLFPEWMQAIGKCLPTYQLMELIKTFLNKGQINVLASVYLTLFTLVLFTLVIVYRRHSEVRT